MPTTAPGAPHGRRPSAEGELYLCGQCASRHWPALSAQGWTFWPLGVHALAPQASAAAGYGPVGDAAEPSPQPWLLRPMMDRRKMLSRPRRLA